MRALAKKTVQRLALSWRPSLPHLRRPALLRAGSAPASTPGQHQTGRPMVHVSHGAHTRARIPSLRLRGTELSRYRLCANRAMHFDSPPHGAQFPILSLSALADALQFKRDTAPESFPSQMKWWCASDFRVWSGTQWVLLEGWQAWRPLGRASPGKRVTNPPPDPWNDAGPNETVSALRCFARRPGSAAACTLRMSQLVAPRLSSSPPTQKVEGDSVRVAKRVVSRLASTRPK